MQHRFVLLTRSISLTKLFSMFSSLSLVHRYHFWYLANQLLPNHCIRSRLVRCLKNMLLITEYASISCLVFCGRQPTRLSCVSIHKCKRTPVADEIFCFAFIKFKHTSFLSFYIFIKSENRSAVCRLQEHILPTFHMCMERMCVAGDRPETEYVEPLLFCN